MNLSISTENPVVYKSDTEIVDVMKNEQAIIFFGFSKCPWCRSAIETLLKVCEQNDIKTLYYVDIYNIRDTYKINDSMIGIGQILTADFESMNKKVNSLVNYLNEVSKNEEIRVVTLFVTNIFENTSYCLYNKDSEEIIKNAFDLKEVYEGVPLKDVVSRKIQIAPYIMDALEKE